MQSTNKVIFITCYYPLEKHICYFFYCVLLYQYL